MTQHQQLQKKINGIIQPDAEKLLAFGCEIIANTKTEHHYYGTNFIIDDNMVSFCKNKISLFGDEFDISDFEILGQKLNLEAVLMGLEIIGNSPYYFKIKSNVFTFLLDSNFIEYHLLLPPDQQPIETQKALFEIFEIK